MSVGGTKSPGIYMMDTDTGIETVLVEMSSSPFLCYPVWSRAGADEVYYTDFTGGQVRIRAVLTAAPWTQRTIASVPSNGQRQKIGVNSNGTLLHAGIQPTTGGSYRTVIARTNGLGILPGWDITGPASADGAIWHTINPDLIGASRNNGAESLKVWNVWTLVQVHVTSFRASHAAWSPGGRMYQIDSGTVRIVDTGALVVPDKGGQGAVHPHFNPADAALGAVSPNSVRFVADEAPFFFNPYNMPMLWITTLAQALAASQAVGTPTQSNVHRAGTQHALHWSNSSSNGAHPHPMWSPDGSRITWATDKAWRPALASPIFPGTTLADHFPGPTGGSTDLFMSLTGAASSAAQGILPASAGLAASLTLEVVKEGGFAASSLFTGAGTLPEIDVVGDLAATASLDIRWNVLVEGDFGALADLLAEPNGSLTIIPDLVEGEVEVITPTVTLGAVNIFPLIQTLMGQILPLHVTNGAVPRLYTVRVTGTYTIQIEDVNDGIGE